MLSGNHGSAGQLQFGPSEVTELAEDLLEDLTAMGRLREAAGLVQQYLQDPDRAVDLLTQVCTLISVPGSASWRTQPLPWMAGACCMDRLDLWVKAH